MQIINTRKEHDCVKCGKLIAKGSTVLKYYTEGGSYPVRRYACKICAIELLNFTKEALGG